MSNWTKYEGSECQPDAQTEGIAEPSSGHGETMRKESWCHL